MFVKIKKLDSSYEEETLRLYADSLKYDNYFQSAFGEVKVDSNLYKTYRQAVEYMLKEGHCYGAFVKDVLIGCILTVDYDLLRSGSTEVYDMFFGDATAYMDAIRVYNDTVPGDVEFMVAITVTPAHQHKGVASKLLKKYCKTVAAGTTVVTDCYHCDRPHLFTRNGFNGVDLQGEKIFTIGVRRF